MNTNSKYLGLKRLLEENRRWPLRYMFKFIIPNREGKVEAVKALMPTGGQLKFKHTNGLKYVSLTCIAHMKSADDIITLTQTAEEIEGVMAL